MSDLILSIPWEHLDKMFNAIGTIDTVFKELFREWVSTRAKYADAVSDIACQISVIKEFVAHDDFSILDTNYKFSRFSVFISNLTDLLKELQLFRIRHRPNYFGDRKLMEDRLRYSLSEIVISLNLISPYLKTQN